MKTVTLTNKLHRAFVGPVIQQSTHVINTVKKCRTARSDLNIDSCTLKLETEIRPEIGAIQFLLARRKKGKVFPYSLPSVGPGADPGADPGVQAVSPQVT